MQRYSVLHKKCEIFNVTFNRGGFETNEGSFKLSIGNITIEQPVDKYW